MDNQYRHKYLLLSALLFVLGGLFLLRGAGRALSGGSDLIHLYTAIVLWAEGGDPYDGAQCVEVARRAGYFNPEHVGEGSLYPPSTLAALAPIGQFGWSTARFIWLVLNLLACGALVWAAASWLVIKDAAMRWMLASLIVLAMGAVATSLSLGQLSLVTAACLFSGLVLLERGRVWLAGLLFGYACLVKPQMGMGFLLLIMLLRQWRAFGAGATLVLAGAAVGVGRLMASAPDWLVQLRENLEVGQAQGGILDAAVGGAMRYQMIDLRPILHLALPAGWVGLSAWVVVGLLAVLALWRLFRLGLHEHLLLAASGVGLLILMPVYHRYYDAVLLLPLFVLVVNALIRGNNSLPVWVIAIAILAMLFPTPSLLAVLAKQGTIPGSIADTVVWQHLVLQHQSWCLLIAALALVWWTWRLPLPSEANLQTPGSAD